MIIREEKNIAAHYRANEGGVGNVEERDGVTDKFAKVTHHLYDISLDYGGLNVNRCSIEK